METYTTTTTGKLFYTTLIVIKNKEEFLKEYDALNTLDLGETFVLKGKSADGAILSIKVSETGLYSGRRTVEAFSGVYPVSVTSLRTLQ